MGIIYCTFIFFIFTDFTDSANLTSVVPNCTCYSCTNIFIMIIGLFIRINHIVYILCNHGLFELFTKFSCCSEIWNLITTKNLHFPHNSCHPKFIICSHLSSSEIHILLTNLYKQHCHYTESWKTCYDLNCHVDCEFRGNILNFI